MSMSNISSRLSAISEQIKKGVAGPTETVRTFLSWFGAERRGYWVVEEINKELDRHDLVTEPSFESTWIDGPITLMRKPKKQADDAPVDPTFRLGRLEAANKEIVSVTPNDSLDKAITLMLTNDFSQLPVMNGLRDVKGIISWKSIGSRLALSKPCLQCKDFMEPPQVISEDVSLLEAVEIIANYDYVLVQKADKCIGGLVTASDFSLQFRAMSEPFLLVGEIENGIRHLLHGKFNSKELQAVRAEGDADRAVRSPSDLTFGEYVRLLSAETNWVKLGVKIDRVEFIKQLDRVRRIRNDVMHFDPDGIDPDNKKFLSEFAQFLNRVRGILR